MSLKVYKKLLSARQVMEKVERSGENNHRKNNYMTLEDIYNASIKPLMENGLIVLHQKEIKDDKMILTTKIVDVDSGEFISSVSLINGNMDAQGIGSQLTYFKKYDLAGLLAMRSDFDDDADKIKNKEISSSIITDSQYKLLMSLINKMEDPEKVKEYYLKALKVEDLKDIPKVKFQNVIDTLKSKLNENNL